jgi:serine protein kinase
MPPARAEQTGGENMSAQPEFLSLIDQFTQDNAYQALHWEGTMADYLGIIQENPEILRDAFQRIYDLIVSYGTEEYAENKEKLVRYKYFSDPDNGGMDAVFGLERPLMHLVNIFKSASRHYGTERRILLLHGPVGSAKSTITRLLKKGLETYSRKPQGALYAFAWRLDDSGKGEAAEACPMHEEPLHLLPRAVRGPLLEKFKARVNGNLKNLIDADLCPSCRFYYRTFMQKYAGDLKRVLEHVRVYRLILSEQDRIGIGTFQPKDEKNQDSTELTGDINYRKIAVYGSDSDPRAFNFDGEFNVANRGLIEFVEVLKLDVAFLYDLLCASQEHVIKPKKFPQTRIDEVIIGHTNEPEYKKLQNNEFMEALRDRTVKIDVPYITRLSEEVKVYEKDYGPDRVQGKHIAPHTLEMGAMWAVLTRLGVPKKANLTLLQKLKLYNGKTLPGFTEENIKELKEEADREGMEGISPRYIQDKISNALVSEEAEGCVNPFMVLNEMESGLDHHSLITSEEQKKRFRELMSVVKDEYA